MLSRAFGGPAIPDASGRRMSDALLPLLVLLHDTRRTGALVAALRLFDSVREHIRPTFVRPRVMPDARVLDSEFSALGTVIEGPWLASVGFRGLVSSAARLGRARASLSFQPRPRLIYVNSAAALPLLDLFGNSRLPFLVHIHELSLGLAPFWKHAVRWLPRASLIVAASCAVAEELHRSLRVPREKMVVVPGTLPRAFAETPVPEVARGSWVIGGIGPPTRLKGIEFWCLAARELLEREGGRTIRFRWIGASDGQDTAFFRKMLDRFGLTSCTDVEENRTLQVEDFHNLDAVWSTSWEESFGLTVLEAAAAGTPCFFFNDMGGPLEIIDEPIFAIPGRSPGLLAERTAELLRSNDLQAIRLALSNSVRRRYSQAVVAPRFISALQRASAG